MTTLLVFSETAAVTIDRHDLIDNFGQALLDGTGALFIGAGLSLDAGLPSWGNLLNPIRERADVPWLDDLPLMAEHIANSTKAGRTALDAEILKQITAKNIQPQPGHSLINRLPVREIWTTNYDQLLEKACPQCAVVVTEEDVRLVGSHKRTVIKMHGSVAEGPRWGAEPVITRTDYETYPDVRPRTWAVLQGAYLSRTFLFLGFSFTDPNVEVLLKLARRYGLPRDGHHMTVLRRPDGTDGDELRKHCLRVEDLERSGVRVHEVNDFAELQPLLEALVRRTRPPRLFISGSEGTRTRPEIAATSSVVGSELAGRTEWELTSLGGVAGWHVTQEVARIRKKEGTYNPLQLRFSFRRTATAAPVLEDRVGTAVYTDLTREALVPLLLEDCRAMLVIGGGSRTAEEIDWANERGVGVIPLACSGGTAHTYWNDSLASRRLLGGRPVDPAEWDRLASPNENVSARAATRLLAQAMYSQVAP